MLGIIGKAKKTISSFVGMGNLRPNTSCLNNKSPKLQVYHVVNGCSELLQVSLRSVDNLQPLPDTLVIESGIYRVGENVVNCSKPGVYRFIEMGSSFKQRYVKHHRELENLASVGELWVVGNVDDKEFQGRDSKYRQITMAKVPNLSCGFTAKLAIEVLKDCGICAREIMGVDVDWDGYDDGHTLLEVLMGGRWVVYDPSYLVLFKYDLEYVNFLELVQHIEKGNEIQIDRFSRLSPVGIWRDGDCELTQWAIHKFVSDSYLMQWYRRVFKVPVVIVDGVQIFPKEFVPSRRLKAFDAQYRPINLLDFKQLLYSE